MQHPSAPSTPSTPSTDTPPPPLVHADSAECDPASVHDADHREHSDMVVPGAVSPSSGITRGSSQADRHSHEPALSSSMTTAIEILATTGSSITSSLDDAAQDSSTPDPTGMLPVEGTMLEAEQPGADCTPSLTLPTHSTDTRAEGPASTAATCVQPTTLPETRRPLSPMPAPSPLSLSLGSTPLFTPLPTAADQPPPYSPTHTILPHYFSLEPIPLRSYLIKDSASMPFLYDFYLCATTSTSASPTLQLQERGLAPQLHQSELKYCIIRPQRTDRTAIPITNTLGPNTDLDFIPALALVAANYPARWIWWGTEALQMVVFGRQLKNVIMEWKWKHGRTRIGGPVVHRLIGCSFRVAPDRRYCWRAGSGKRKNQVDATGAQRRTGNGEGNSGSNGSNNINGNNSNSNSNGNGNSHSRRHHSRELALPARPELSRAAAGGGWFNSFFTRTTNASGAESQSDDVPLERVRASTPPLSRTPRGETEGSMAEEPEISTHVDGIPLSIQEATANGNDEDDEELGCYHCREESPSGAIGRIVAVYRPGRPADRARDRPATYRRLEIYTEVGDRCETAMMLMCTRLDDLFMSIPEEKKTGVFVSNHRSSEAVLANSTAIGGPDSADGAAEGNNFGPENGEDAGRAARAEGRVLANDQRSEISVLKRLFAGQYTWRSWLKWTVAAILIAVVVVLLKPKLSG